MTTPNVEDLLRKVRGLLALAERGATEAERDSAERKLQALVSKYNLDLAAARGTDASTMCEVEIKGKYNESWRKHCYAAAAKLYMCKYLFESVRGESYAAIHHLIGEAHNVAVAQEVGAYFEAAVNRLANEATRVEMAARPDAHTQRHQFIRSFRLSATHRLLERVEERLREAREGGVVDEDSGTTLPALASLYDLSEEACLAWIERQSYTVRDSAAPRDQLLSGSGARQGRKAGDNISLSTQLKGEANRFALTS